MSRPFPLPFNWPSSSAHQELNCDQPSDVKIPWRPCSAKGFDLGRVNCAVVCAKFKWSSFVSSNPTQPNLSSLPPTAQAPMNPQQESQEPVASVPDAVAPSWSPPQGRCVFFGVPHVATHFFQLVFPLLTPNSSITPGRFTTRTVTSPRLFNVFSNLGMESISMFSPLESREPSESGGQVSGPTC